MCKFIDLSPNGCFSIPISLMLSILNWLILKSLSRQHNLNSSFSPLTMTKSSIYCVSYKKNHTHTKYDSGMVGWSSKFNEMKLRIKIQLLNFKLFAIERTNGWSKWVNSFSDSHPKIFTTDSIVLLKWLFHRYKHFNWIKTILNLSWNCLNAKSQPIILAKKHKHTTVSSYAYNDRMNWEMSICISCNQNRQFIFCVFTIDDKKWTM